MIQGVEVVQLVIWSTDQGVEVDPLVIGQHVWSTNQGVGVDQLVIGQHANQGGEIRSTRG